MQLSREHIFKPSRTNTTGKQVRKHSIQMTKGEKVRCANLVKGSLQMFGISLSKHVQDRGTKVDVIDIINIILSDNFFEQVIEYNERKSINNLWAQRVLFNIPIEKEFICDTTDSVKSGYLKVVYEVTTGVIITAYFNECTDKHETLNLTHYNSNLLVRPYVTNGYVQENGGIKF